ncbi:MAG: hypothetical protein VB135_02605 [Burkholderia sp.]
MQIREQGRKIQCIRAVYDKGIGRGRQVVVATLPRWGSAAPADDVLAKLTDTEREQLTDFLAKRREESEAPLPLETQQNRGGLCPEGSPQIEANKPAPFCGKPLLNC